MTRRTQWEQAYAVIRVDHYSTDRPVMPLEGGGPSIDIGDFQITVKEVVRTEAAARAEVERLNSLNADSHCAYYWQGTHYFPDGGSFGAEGAGA